jgi:hypothetical protein
MPYPRDPIVEPVPIESLRPTQMTVGMREVEDKRKRLHGQKGKKMGKFVGVRRSATTSSIIII